MQRTMDLTERHATLRAAGSLFGHLGPQILFVDFLEIVRPSGRRAFLRVLLNDIDKLKQALCHGIPFLEAPS